MNALRTAVNVVLLVSGPVLALLGIGTWGAAIASWLVWVAGMAYCAIKAIFVGVKAREEWEALPESERPKEPEPSASDMRTLTRIGWVVWVLVSAAMVAVLWFGTGR